MQQRPHFSHIRNHRCQAVKFLMHLKYTRNTDDIVVQISQQTPTRIRKQVSLTRKSLQWRNKKYGNHSPTLNTRQQGGHTSLAPLNLAVVTIRLKVFTSWWWGSPPACQLLASYDQRSVIISITSRCWIWLGVWRSPISSITLLFERWRLGLLPFFQKFTLTGKTQPNWMAQ